MKKLLIEIDDRCARDLERVAPSKDRKRSEFIRLAIRRAIDLALDRDTEEAYRRQPLTFDVRGELDGWDPNNQLAIHERRKPAPARHADGRSPRRKRRAA